MRFWVLPGALSAHSELCLCSPVPALAWISWAEGGLAVEPGVGLLCHVLVPVCSLIQRGQGRVHEGPGGERGRGDGALSCPHEGFAVGYPLWECPSLSLCQWFLVPLQVALASLSPSLLCTRASALIDMQSFSSLFY